MSKFSKKQDSVVEFSNSTNPVHDVCTVCHFSNDGIADEKLKRSFVRYLNVRNHATGNVKSGTPGEFCLTDSHGNYMGSSSEGYKLKDHYRFDKWTVLCDRCQTTRTKRIYASKKSYNLIPDSEQKTKNITQALSSLKKMEMPYG